MKRALIAIAAASVLGLSANAFATVVTVIDFDTLSDGDKIFDQYTDLGVKFRDQWSPYHIGAGSSPGIVTSDYSFSGPNSLLIGNPGDDDDGDGDDDDGNNYKLPSWQDTYTSGGDDNDGMGDGDDDDGMGGSNSVFILFDQPILNFNAYVLGVCGGGDDDDSDRTGGGGDGDDDDGGACAPDIFLNAYDVNGDLVATTGLTGNDVDWMLLSFTSMGTEIFEIELGLAGGFGDGDDDDGGSAFAIDDITFKPVPVPAALWLLGSGLFGLVAMRRRITS